MYMKKITIILVFLFSGLAMTDVAAQFGAGLVLSGDYYQWYRNPTVAGETEQQSAGNAILNGGIGPKVWIGKGGFSFSLEGQFNMGITAFDMHEYKGMGNIAFPLLAKLNFGALSSFKSDADKGFYIGGGLQYSRTEAYGLTADFDGNTTRGLFRTIVGEIGYGVGGKGFVASTFVRLGFEKDNAFTLNVGSVIDLNFSKLRKEINLDETEEDVQIQSFL